MKKLLGYFGFIGNRGHETRQASIAIRTGKHKDQEVDRQRVANARREKIKRAKRIARASRRGNRA